MALTSLQQCLYVRLNVLPNCCEILLMELEFYSQATYTAHILLAVLLAVLQTIYTYIG